MLVGSRHASQFCRPSDGTDLHPGPKEYIFNATPRWMDPNGDGDPGDGIDGWRLDVANEVPDQFWMDWHPTVRKIIPGHTRPPRSGRTQRIPERLRLHGHDELPRFRVSHERFPVDDRMQPSEFAEELAARRDQYDEPTRYALQNLIDSHDTDRVASMIVNAKGSRTTCGPPVSITTSRNGHLRVRSTLI